MANVREASYGSERVLLEAIKGNLTLPTFTRAPKRKKKEKRARDVYNKEQPGLIKRLFEKLLSKLSKFHGSKQRDPRIYFHLVRHAEVCSLFLLFTVKGSRYQAAHNDPSLSKKDRMGWFDPPLNNHGVRQCRHLAQTFPHMDKITHVMVSPSKRTLQTCLLAFSEVFDRGLIGLVLSELRELTSFINCNAGPTRAELMLSYVDKPLCFTILKQDWHEDMDWKNRGRRVREFLGGFVDDMIAGRSWRGLQIDGTEGKDVHILVVSHQNILGDILGHPKEEGSRPLASLYHQRIWLTCYRTPLGKHRIQDL